MCDFTDVAHTYVSEARVTLLVVGVRSDVCFLRGRGLGVLEYVFSLVH